LHKSCWNSLMGCSKEINMWNHLQLPKPQGGRNDAICRDLCPWRQTIFILKSCTRLQSNTLNSFFKCRRVCNSEKNYVYFSQSLREFYVWYFRFFFSAVGVGSLNIAMPFSLLMLLLSNFLLVSSFQVLFKFASPLAMALGVEPWPHGWVQLAHSCVASVGAIFQSCALQNQDPIGW
jgi:hypothetical protein